MCFGVCNNPPAYWHMNMQWAMRQRILGLHTPPCHRRMVISTLFSVFLAALQRTPHLHHTRWLHAVGGARLLALGDKDV